MICDGEEIMMVCKDCGYRFRHIIGYGPISPLPGEREKRLKKAPPVCPRCHGTNVRRQDDPPYPWDIDNPKIP